MKMDLLVSPRMQLYLRSVLLSDIFSGTNTHTGSVPVIGPLRSIAWLAGLDGLVEAIDSPACETLGQNLVYEDYF